MKARMQLVDGTNWIERIFDWNDVIETNNGLVKVSKISVYDDKPIIDGKEFNIYHMLSSENPELIGE